MLNAYPPVDGERDAWWLPDVAFASEAWAMLELTVTPERVAAAGDVFKPAVSVSVQAKVWDASPLYVIAGLPALPVLDPGALVAMPRDPLVETRLLELGAAHALEKVRAALAAGDWALARSLLDRALETYAAHAWAATILATMQQLVNDGDPAVVHKELRYSMHSLNFRLASQEEDGRQADEPDSVPLYLRRKGSQGTGTRR